MVVESSLAGIEHKDTREHHVHVAIVSNILYYIFIFTC